MRRAGVFYGVSLRGTEDRPLVGAGNKWRNRKRSSVRTRVEHVFRVMKCQFGYRRARYYRGIASNAAQVLTLLGLTNLYSRRWLAA